MTTTFGTAVNDRNKRNIGNLTLHKEDLTMLYLKKSSWNAVVFRQLCVEQKKQSSDKIYE